jgi:hypothetical protein
MVSAVKSFSKPAKLDTHQSGKSGIKAFATEQTGVFEGNP